MVHVKWEPFRDLMAMQNRMTRLFDETLTRIFKEEVPGSVWSPPVDIVERENELILKVDLPEINEREIDIKVEENTLIIRGERRFSKEVPGENYIQIERPYGNFRRTFTLPKMIEKEAIKASHKDGVLRIVLPKKKEVHPKQISVETS
ncbi:MAG: Hsp20/alpha crystallin family protein [Thermodesulfobacteriota bacterium]|nr:Hsp20/alpha crystallin family protein [Thermodesulfobacteriota bacterium]